MKLLSSNNRKKLNAIEEELISKEAELKEWDSEDKKEQIKLQMTIGMIQKKDTNFFIKEEKSRIEQEINLLNNKLKELFEKNRD